MEGSFGFGFSFFSGVFTYVTSVNSSSTSKTMPNLASSAAERPLVAVSSYFYSSSSPVVDSSPSSSASGDSPINKNSISYIFSLSRMFPILSSPETVEPTSVGEKSVKSIFRETFPVLVSKDPLIFTSLRASVVASSTSKLTDTKSKPFPWNLPRSILSLLPNSTS